MAGPVWRFEASLVASCAVCLGERKGVFVEGEVTDNQLHHGRSICPECFARESAMVVEGESGRHVFAPAYGRKP